MTAETASLAENIDAPRPRRRLAWLRRALVGLFNPRRKLTKAERREIDAEQLERARARSAEAGLQLEAEQYARDLRMKLKDKGVRYEYRKRDGTGLARFKLVEFRRPYVIRDEAIYLCVDLRPGKSPPGIGVKELSNPEILPDLEIAVGHPVKHHYSAKSGFWFIIEREAGRRGIPNHVNYDDVLASRPPTIDKLSLPIGMRSDKKFYWQTLKRFYSLLVAGTPGTGKSNMINGMICALLKHNSPRELNLILVDLKGGVEFTFYEGVPHLLPVPVDDQGTEKAIIERREQVLPALEWLIKEGERRLELLKKQRVKTIGEYNQHWGPLAHIVLVIDEWADVKVEPKLGNRAEELLTNVSNRFRAAGIHVILCTQSPTREVISLRIKNAIPAKLAFSMSNIYASMLVVGNGQAQGLEPVGRAIFDWNQVQFELQTPLINNEQVDRMVAQAIKGEWDDAPARAHDVADIEIYEWALDFNDGYLESLAIYNKFRGRKLSKEYAEKFCREAEGKSVLANDNVYKVLPRHKQHAGRRLITVEQLEAEEQARLDGPKVDAPAVTEQEVVEWALAENKGRLHKQAVWEQFRERGLSNKAAGDLLRDLEGKVVTVAGREYRVLPNVARRGSEVALPRRLEALVPLPASETTSETAPAAGPGPGTAEPDGAAAGSESPAFFVDFPGAQAASETSGARLPARPSETIAGPTVEPANGVTLTPLVQGVNE